MHKSQTVDYTTGNSVFHIMINIKNDLSNTLFKSVKKLVFKTRLSIKHVINSKRSVESVFTKIYTTGEWSMDEEGFCSGYGSVNQEIVNGYLSAVFSKIQSEGLLNKEYIDLGCGDYRVAKNYINWCSKYTGVDVVKPVIDYNRKHYSSENVEFLHLDIIDNALPDGDVCFLRQVLQHLSNGEIKTILKKLSKYKLVIIMEHYPFDVDHPVHNIDKVHGGDIRLYINSGVYLDMPPFNLSKDRLEMIFEHNLNEDNEIPQGVIRTFAYKPQ